MNDSDRKSMDDVLASIRRIVRSEKEAAVASASGEGPHDHRREGSEAEEPLMLTPDMRTDGGAEGTGAATELGADLGAGLSEAPTAPEPAIPDREALRAMVRELLREEFSGSTTEDAVRRIIRDELTSGEVGKNISQNVLRAIRSEVAKALQAAR